MPSFQVVLTEQIACTSTAFGSALADAEALAAFTRSLNSIAALEKVLLTVKTRREFKLYSQSLKEIQHSLMAAATANYRNSFSSLRLSFELSMAGLEFSTNERLLRSWELGLEDIFWTRLSDKDNGVLSPKQAKLFFPGLEDNVSHFWNLATTVYRECSEYVHGNPSATEKLPDTLRYDRNVVFDWAAKLDTIQLVLIFSFCVRYLRDMDKEQRDSIAETLSDQVGHIGILRATFDGSLGG